MKPLPIPPLPKLKHHRALKSSSEAEPETHEDPVAYQPEYIVFRLPPTIRRPCSDALPGWQKFPKSPFDDLYNACGSSQVTDLELPKNTWI